MAVNFAALEDRTARASLRHLSNAVASGLDRFGAAVEFEVVFDAQPAEAMGLEVSRPQVLALSAQVAELQHQGLLTITRKTETLGAQFFIVNHEPDPTGLARLVLECAQ